jgi:methyl-accepting chemotaxis protein
MHTLPLKKKLTFLFGVMVVSFVGLGINSHLRLAAILADWEYFQGQVVKRQELLMTITAHFGYGGAIHNFKNMVLRGDKKHADRFSANYDATITAIKHYLALENVSGKEKQSLATVQETLDQYKAALTQAQQMWSEGRAISEIDGMVKIDDSPALNAFVAIDGVYRDLTLERRTILSDRIAASNAITISLLSVTLLIALLLIVISRSITRPLAQITAALLDMGEGEGDLTKRLSVTSKDEMGQACDAFNRFVAKIQGNMARVADATSSLASAAEELSANTVQLAKGGQEQAQQAVQAAAAVEEMSATVTQMAKNAQSVAGSANEASQAASQGNEVVAGSIDGMTRLAETVRAFAERIQSLGQRSGQIGEIVKVIEDIADQTNLLALNAAIEAARAGEQGRGFAVVADEVRKLAERTTKATKEIADTIRTIQEDTGQAVASMEVGTQEAQAGVALVNKAGERLAEIDTAVRTVTGMVQQIAAAIEQQSAATEQVSGNVEAVAAVSKRSEGGLAQVTQATTELARLAGELQGVVGGFKLKG